MSKKLQRKLKKQIKLKNAQNDPPTDTVDSQEQVQPIENDAQVKTSAVIDSSPTTEDRTASKWINRQRVLVIASRGITYRDRHLLLNLRAMLPHAKTDSKLDGKDPLQTINQLCEMKNCNKAIYIMNRKHRDCYMWLSNVPRGPSAIFLLENIHTFEELRLPGNCLVGSRPLLSFDDKFDKLPHLQVLKELLTQIFGTPNYYPKSQPFYDHVFQFSFNDNRVWFRNYEILNEDLCDLNEIGPRFTMNPIKIFDGSFGGPVIYSNPDYVSPSKHRAMIKREAMEKYKKTKLSNLSRQERLPHGEEYADIDQYNDVFDESAVAAN